MGFRQGPQTTHLEEVHATALQKVHDITNLPSSFRKQVLAVARSCQKAAPLLVASATANSVTMTNCGCGPCYIQSTSVAGVRLLSGIAINASHVSRIYIVLYILLKPCKSQRVRESKMISAISSRCASQSLADMLHSEGVPKYVAKLECLECL